MHSWTLDYLDLEYLALHFILLATGVARAGTDTYITVAPIYRDKPIFDQGLRRGFTLLKILYIYTLASLQKRVANKSCKPYQLTTQKAEKAHPQPLP